MIECMKKICLIGFILLSACSGIYQGDELPDLKGKTDEQVLRVLGKPVAERKEGTSKMWAYCQNECSTLIFFDSQNVVQYAESRGKCPSEDLKLQGEI